MANLFKNWLEDRNNGRLKKNQQRAEDIKNNVYRDKTEQKQLDKALYKVGVGESKANRYTRQPSVVVKQTNISKDDHSKRGLVDSSITIASNNSKSASSKTPTKPTKPAKQQKTQKTDKKKK